MQSISISNGPVHTGTQKKMRAGGLLGKVALVNFVECFEMLWAYTEYVDLHDVLEVRSRRLKCRLQLFQDAFGLLFEGCVDEKFTGLGKQMAADPR